MRMPVASTICSAAIAFMIFTAPAMAQLKTAKQCNAEYAADKAQIQANGQKKKDFIKACRAQTADTTATTPAATPTSTPTSVTRPAPMKATSTGAGQFSTEAAAKAHCPGDAVVWGNTKSKVYHFAGTRDYGNTKAGAYLCEKESAGEGFRAAKNEKHP